MGEPQPTCNGTVPLPDLATGIDTGTGQYLDCTVKIYGTPAPV